MNKPNTSLAAALAQPTEDGSSVEFDPPRLDFRPKSAEWTSFAREPLADADLLSERPAVIESDRFDLSGAEIPTAAGIRQFIADLAKQHDVRYVETGLTAMARVFTHLSDKDLEPGRPDETEKLLIALKKAEVIDGRTMVELLGRYFDLLDREETEISQLKGVVAKPAAPVSIEKMNEAIAKEGSSNEKVPKPRE